MAGPHGVSLLRICCSFNAISLALLAFQNAGYLVLMGYAQQLQNVPPAAGQPPKRRLASSHFLATTEFVKLLISLGWCAVEVLQDMRREEVALLTTIEVGMHDDFAVEKTNSFGGDSLTKSPMVHTRDGMRLTPSNRQSPTASSLSHPQVPSGSPSKPFIDDNFPLTRLFGRHNFTAQFSARMRHAIGFDEKFKEALLMIVPAVLYTIQGLLLILALQYLDPTVFQILYQIRIMFLALMMRVVLDFQLSPIRWLALVALMGGIILAQLAMQRKGGDSTKAKKPQASWSIEGTLAALAGAFLSSFSGVFMEYVFKKRGNLFTLSARNIHLAFFSLMYFVFVFSRDIWVAERSQSIFENISEFFSTFFDGFTGLVWFLVLLQAAGGILVALVVRYCDNIVKSFSTAFAIVLSGTASVFLFNLPLDPMFLMGSLLVMASITVYSLKK